MISATKRRIRIQNLEKGKESLEILVAYDFEVVQFSPYHFRINNRLDVWPSSKKLYDKKSHSKGQFIDLVEFAMNYQWK